MTSFSFFKYFDAFELDVNVVNFLYCMKTRLTDGSVIELHRETSWFRSGCVISANINEVIPGQTIAHSTCTSMIQALPQFALFLGID